MLSRLKEIVSGNEAKELFAQLSQQLELAAAAMKEQAAAIETLRKESEASKVAAAAAVNELRSATKAAQELQEELRTSLSDLKALSTHIQSSIKQKISEDLTALTHEVKAKLEGSERLKSEMATAASAVNAELATLRADVTKIAAIAAGIKAEDFELSKFAHQLQTADKEKLQLLSRIDNLERMIAKMRRHE